MILLELRPLIIEWARDKELINLSIAPKQRLKLLEELGELARAVLLNNINLQKDAIGYIAVVLIILNEQTNSSLEFDFSKVTKSKETDLYEMLKMVSFLTNYLFCELSLLNDIANILGLDLEECANIAWNEIKDRKGKTLNGTFIKN